MMDDLRDYRFYADDLLHPSAQAVEYIWQKFCAALISTESQSVFPAVEKIQRFIAHRPKWPESDEHKKNKEQMLKEVELGRTRFPDADWSQVIQLLQT
jgi:ribonuclease HI